MLLSYWSSPSKKSSMPPFQHASGPMTCKIVHSGSPVEQRAYLCIEKCNGAIRSGYEMSTYTHFP